LTHTVTHTRKKADGDNGRERVKDHAPPQQKGPESTGKRHFRGFQSLGKDEVGGSNPPSSSRKSSFSCGKGWIFLVFQHFFHCFNFLDLDLTTQPATDREKRLTEGISHSVSRRFSLPCFQPLLFSGDLRFHLEDHLRQQLLTFLPGLGVDISGVLLAIRPDGGVAALPQMVVDLSDASGPRFTPLAFVGLECTGNRLPRC
jgi:hypothetical protein